MANQSEDAILNVKINGQDAISTFTQLNQLRKEQITLVKNLNENTPQYDEQSKKLQNLNAQYDVWRQKIYGVGAATAEVSTELEEQTAIINEFKEGITGAFEAVGLGLSIGELISFGKELVDVEKKAEGITNAFSKIGNTSADIEKLRISSRGLMTDLDLEKFAVKANDANIPIEKLGQFLEFAEQRARDTGESVDDVADKLITGLGKNSPKALAGLGVSVVEVKEEFKKTGDMVTAVSNIISREMGASGTDVENFGDRIDTVNTRMDNAKEKLAGLFKIFMGYRDLADPEEIEAQSAANIKALGDFKSKSDEDLDKMITEQQLKLKAAAANNDKAQKALAQVKNDHPFLYSIGGDKATSYDANAKKNAEAYQAERNALAALNKEKEKRVTAGEQGDDAADKKKKKDDQLAKEQAQKDQEFLKTKESFLEKSKQLTAQYEQFMGGVSTAIMSENDKQVQETKNKYDQEIALQEKFIAQAKDTKAQAASNPNLTKSQKADITNTAQTGINTANSDIDNLRAAKDKAVNDLIIKQHQELNTAIQQFQEQQTGAMGSELDKQEAKINAFYDDQQKKLGAGNIDDIATIEANRIISLAQAELNAKKKLIEEEEQLDDQYAEFTDDKDANSQAAIKKKYDKERADLKKQYGDKLELTQEYQKALAKINRNEQAETDGLQKEKDKAIKTAAIQVAQDVANAAFTIAQNNRDADLDAGLAKLEKERTADLNNSSLTASQKTAINAKYDAEEAEMKLKKWKADQKAAELSAAINGALGVTAALTAMPWSYANFVNAGLVAAAAIAQEAVISNEKAPQFADGGMLPVGATHAAGGLNVIDPLGNLIANIEGGEPILSRKTAAANPGLVKALLASGGKTIDYGKVVAASNSVRIGATHTSKLASGSSTANGYGAGTTNNQLMSSGHLDRMEAMFNKAMQLITLTDSKPVILSNRVRQDHDTKLVQIQDSVNG